MRISMVCSLGCSGVYPLDYIGTKAKAKPKATPNYEQKATQKTTPNKQPK